MKSFKKNAYTLLELLLVLAILAVLSMGIYSIFKFGFHSLSIGEERADVRTNVKFAADFISSELREATHIQIVETLPSLSSFEAGGSLEGYKAIYVKDGLLTQINQSGIEKVRQSGIARILALEEALHFSLENGLLYFKVTNDPLQGEDDYSIESKVKLLNIPLDELFYTGPKDIILYKSNALISVSGIQINEGDQTIEISQQLSFTVTVIPDDAVNPLVHWSSSDGNIAIVNNSGEVVGLSPGTVTITATTDDGNYTDTVTVTVITGSSDQVPIENVFVFGTTMNISGSTDVVIGENQQGTVVITNTTPSNITFGGATNVILKDIYVEKEGNHININGSANLGELGTTEIINMKGETFISGTGNIEAQNVFLDGDTSLSGTGGIRGEIVVIDGHTDLSGTSFIEASQIYIRGDVSLDGSALLEADKIVIYGDLNLETTVPLSPEELYVKGNVRLDNSNINLTNPTGNVYIDGSLGLIRWGDSVSGSNIFVKGLTVLERGTNISGEEIYIDGHATLKSQSSVSDFSTLMVHDSLSLTGASAIIYGGFSYVWEDLSFASYSDITGSLAFLGTLYPFDYEYTATKIEPNPFPSFPEMLDFPGFPIIPPQPNLPMPVLRDASWYAERGYENTSALESGDKIYSPSNYTRTGWSDTPFENIIIVSGGDVTLGGWIEASGVIIAPNGKVTFEGYSFKGVVIAKDGFYVTSGNAYVEFRSIGEYFEQLSDYPFVQ